jgi:hypothetical protein
MVMTYFPLSFAGLPVVAYIIEVGRRKEKGLEVSGLFRTGCAELKHAVGMVEYMRSYS